MRSARFRPAAEADLAEIQDYISRDHPAAARRLVQSLQARCLAIAATPNIGRPRDSLMKGLRSVTFGNYLIFYSVGHDDITVERILHGRRDVDRQF